MSRCTQLVLVLSLAACEHSQPAAQEPMFAPHAEPAAPQPGAEPAPLVEKPVAETAVPAEPAVAPAQPTAPAAVKTAPKAKVLTKKCNPMSRAGCRWQDEKDERDEPRVKKAGDGGAN